MREGDTEREGPQATSGGEDTWPHITSLLTSSDRRAAEQLCLCFAQQSLGRIRQSDASSKLSPDKEEEEEEEVSSDHWARNTTKMTGTFTDWGAMGGVGKLL